MSAKAFCICRRLLLPGLAVLLTLLLCLSAWLLADGDPSPLRTAPATPDIRTNAVTGSFPFRCVVIDAGHGGGTAVRKAPTVCLRKTSICR